MNQELRRYTELPYVIDLLRRKRLVLISPSTWDDRNDSYYIEQFSRSRGLQSTYALCLTQAPETYHHWRVFSHGSGGACIIFNRAKLLKAIDKIRDIRAEAVRYQTIKQLSKSKLGVDELPFLKRYAFQDEREFRLFLGKKEDGPKTFDVPIPLSVVDRIVLSPWLPRSVAISVKGALEAIPGCANLSVQRSLLVDHENWKAFAEVGA